jgi:hypothetical protein
MNSLPFQVEHLVLAIMTKGQGLARGLTFCYSDKTELEIELMRYDIYIKRLTYPSGVADSVASILPHSRSP